MVGTLDEGKSQQEMRISTVKVAPKNSQPWSPRQEESSWAKEPSTESHVESNLRKGEKKNRFHMFGEIGEITGKF